MAAFISATFHFPSYHRYARSIHLNHDTGCGRLGNRTLVAGAAINCFIHCTRASRATKVELVASQKNQKPESFKKTSFKFRSCIRLEKNSLHFLRGPRVPLKLLQKNSICCDCIKVERACSVSLGRARAFEFKASSSLSLPLRQALARN